MTLSKKHNYSRIFLLSIELMSSGITYLSSLLIPSQNLVTHQPAVFKRNNYEWFNNSIGK